MLIFTFLKKKKNLERLLQSCLNQTGQGSMSAMPSELTMLLSDSTGSNRLSRYRSIPLWVWPSLKASDSTADRRTVTKEDLNKTTQNSDTVVCCSYFWSFRRVCTVAKITVRVRQAVGRSATVATAERESRRELLVWVKATAKQSPDKRRRRRGQVLLCRRHSGVHSDVSVDGQASVRSDFSGVVGADDEVALVLWEVCWKLQVCDQVHHIVVTR